ncbi:SAM-dependent methyltransferase [Bacteroides sp. OttesenSCG-928-E20]|nr:SAM-dependent methyltransferase [Bacteroides sp. OttesenSCG-928-E20]MDL2304085.1 SAM-dependent methyltransferase [Bacteroides sp. OttesenSCG-928-D19]
MNIIDASISNKTFEYLRNVFKKDISLSELNNTLHQDTGIVNFFDNQYEFNSFKDTISSQGCESDNPEKAEYGDFQTNVDLANKVVEYLNTKNTSPDIIIEPTCGKGNFILAAINNFKHAEAIYGIEIYKPYIWECKFNIIDFYLNNPREIKPDIIIHHFNVFDFNFAKIEKTHKNKKILIIGNPPWVTNSKLGSLSSNNLPRKVNFKKHNGIDAITGKGNFDIAEYISNLLINTFKESNGEIALLIKNSVIKNIISEQLRNNYNIANIEKLCIDSKKEFNVSVEASLFYCKLNSTPEYDCKEMNFYQSFKVIKRFGWYEQKFISNIDSYKNIKNIDGESPFIWRQGIKHDCTAVMELTISNGLFTNKMNETVELENDLVYGFLKSSDLKSKVVSQTRKYTIITQRNVGQETSFIKDKFPKTYTYLIEHKDFFNSRKSSIYKGKPLFSIFGIGDYSFCPYKIAISGLYKTFHFTLVTPQNNKPIMLDDTCYFIGFDNLEFAVYTLILLNSVQTINLLQAITFPDAKRTFTKEILMRINLLEIAKNIDIEYLQKEINALNLEYNVSLQSWNAYIKKITPTKDKQLSLFAYM